MSNILWEIAQERVRQDGMFGVQNHPDGTTGPKPHALETLRMMRALNARAKLAGTTNWADILSEEVMEVIAENDSAKIRGELVQVAAVAVAWIEAIDRRKA